MTFAVSEKIQKETTKCDHNFSCLKTGQCGGKKLCAVDHSCESSMLSLKSKEHKSCPYNLIYGARQFCMCPTHLAIVKEYGTKASSSVPL